MTALYLKRWALPTLAAGLLLAACDRPSAPEKAAGPSPNNVYLEAVQEAEALRHSIEERNREQQQVDALLDRGQPLTR